MLETDCETHVKNAILKKCKDDVKVLHMFVDCSSQEGCVYVKFASPSEAEKAYKRLHGFWSDGM